MSNLYDVFRGVQDKRKASNIKTSANFIVEGANSNKIRHLRPNIDIDAAIIVDDKEGPNNIMVYTKKGDNLENNLLKGDYFTWENIYYLVYEDIRLTHTDYGFKKQKAVECNVIFSTGTAQSVKGAFISSLRKTLSEDLDKDSIVMATEKPLIITSAEATFKVNDRLVIDGKPWSIFDYDSITNKGIMYLYLERDYNENIPTEQVMPEEENYVAESGEIEIADELVLRSMTTYTFETLDAYFATAPRVDILERKRNSVKFSIPLGIDTVIIGVKDQSGEIVENIYKVVI